MLTIRAISFKGRSLDRVLTARFEETGGTIGRGESNTLVTQLAISHAAGLGALLTDLRYQIQTEYAPDLPKLPLTTITFGLPSFRPPDDLILAATGFSGIPAFIELIDTDAASRLQDPLKTRLQELIR